MAFKYGFYNSLGGDRSYDATDMGQIFNGVISDGIFQSVGNAFAVSASTGMNLSVGSGRARFNNTWSYNDSTMVVAVTASEAVLNRRIDIVVIEIDSSESVRANSIKVVNGTPGSTPVPPTLTNTATNTSISFSSYLCSWWGYKYSSWKYNE